MDNESNQTIYLKNNPKRRVLFIITQSEFGGAQRFLSQLITHLEPGHFELAIVCGPDGNKEIKTMLPKNIRYISARHLRRNPNIFNDIFSLFELKKIVKEFRPDVLFLNSSKAGFNGSLAVKILPVDFPSPKVIYRIGGWAFNDPWPWWKRQAYGWLEKISASWKDYIIVNNKHDYDQAIKLGIKPKKEVVLVYNGIDPYKMNFFEKDEARIRLYELLPQKQGSFLHEGLIIGTIANFYPTKGLGYLLEAMRRLSAIGYRLSAKLVIIGEGPERKSLELQIKEAGLQNVIFLAGRIHDAYKYLKAFDIFVLPSVKEGFPWALLEAMSAKLPVIATTVGANPEIIENNKNGLIVEPLKPDQLAQALKLLLENDRLRQELSIQAHQTVLFKFGLDKMIKQIEKLF